MFKEGGRRGAKGVEERPGKAIRQLPLSGAKNNNSQQA